MKARNSAAQENRLRLDRADFEFFTPDDTDTSARHGRNQTDRGRSAPADKTLDIYWVDVEGGGATLIVTPAGESVLIDSGNPGPRDAGRIHKTASEVAGLKRIDHYIRRNARPTSSSCQSRPTGRATR